MCEKQSKDGQRYAEKYADYVKLLKSTLSKKRVWHLPKSTAVTRKRRTLQDFFMI